MQGFPQQGALTSSAQTLPVPGVQTPLTPARPSIPPAGQLGGPAQGAGFPPPGFGLPGTYPSPFGQPLPSPFGAGAAVPPVSITGAAGPATLGPAPTNNGTGSVAGVSMSPVSGVAAPAATGGPHPLPTLPQFPLPQGFPNPFAVQQLTVPAGASQGQAPLQQPGTGVTFTTGPQGYLPGLGYFGPPPGPGQPGIPGGLTIPAQGPQTSAPPPPAPMPPGGLPQTNLGAAGLPPALLPPTGFLGPGAQFPFPLPGLPQGASKVPPAGAPAGAAPDPAPGTGTGGGSVPVGAPGAQGHPFWVGLAWQLLHSPAVRELLGEKHGPLVLGQDRLRTLGVATSCLIGQELQQAFKALTTGGLGQEKFLQSFATALKAGLQAAGLL